MPKPANRLIIDCTSMDEARKLREHLSTEFNHVGLLSERPGHNAVTIREIDATGCARAFDMTAQFNNRKRAEDADECEYCGKRWTPKHECYGTRGEARDAQRKEDDHR